MLERTPSYEHEDADNNIFLTDDESAAPLKDLLEKIAKEYLFGKVANIVATPTGCYVAATAFDVIEKLEAFQEIITERRIRHLRRNRHLHTDVIFNKKTCRSSTTSGCTTTALG